MCGGISFYMVQCECCCLFVLLVACWTCSASGCQSVSAAPYLSWLLTSLWIYLPVGGCHSLFVLFTCLLISLLLCLSLPACECHFLFCPALFLLAVSYSLHLLLLIFFLVSLLSGMSMWAPLVCSVFCLLTSLFLSLSSGWVASLFVLFTAFWPFSLSLSECECHFFLSLLLPVNLSLFPRMWVSFLIHPVHCLLISFSFSVLIPVCECHLSFILFTACWPLSCSVSAHQYVSATFFPSLLNSHTLTLSVSAYQNVSAALYSSCSLPADLSFTLSLIASLWVPPLVYCIQYLLTSFFHCFHLPGCECHPCSFCLLPADSLTHIFASLWVPLFVCIPCLLTSLCLCLCFSGCECCPWFVPFYAFWPFSYSVSASQDVSVAYCLSFSAC